CFLHHIGHRSLAISVGMPERRNSRDGGQRLLKQSQPLWEQFRTKERQPRDVTPWSCEVGDKPVPDRIAHNRHHNGDSGGRLLCSAGGKRIRCDDEIDSETDQFGRKIPEPLDLAVGGSNLNDYVLTLHVAAFVQRLQEGIEKHPRIRRFERSCSQETNLRTFLGLLRMSGQRQYRRAAEQRHELPAADPIGRDGSFDPALPPTGHAASSQALFYTWRRETSMADRDRTQH